MHVPNPVISLSVKPADRKNLVAFQKALGRFQREDPTFRLHVDPESQETIIQGMGELHLEIYAERSFPSFHISSLFSLPSTSSSPPILIAVYACLGEKP